MTQDLLCLLQLVYVLSVCGMDSVSHYSIPCFVPNIGIFIDIIFKDKPKPKISVNLSHFVQFQVKTMYLYVLL